MKFRKGIGAIVLDQDNEIITFQRADFKNNWQAPEGGVDENETSEEALYRELMEEIGINKNDFIILKKTKEFIKYPFGEYKIPGFDGQEKQFFLIKLNISIDKFKYNNIQNEIEFINCKKTNSNELLHDIPYFKKEMYEKVLTEFGLL